MYSYKHNPDLKRYDIETNSFIPMQKIAGHTKLDFNPHITIHDLPGELKQKAIIQKTDERENSARIFIIK